jgi:hypothetical protein
MKKVISSCILVILICTSCQKKELHSRNEYVLWVENKENGLRKEVTSGDFTYIFQFKPTDYIICKERRDADTATAHRMAQLEHTLWFNLYLKPKDSRKNPLKDKVSGLDEYNQRLSYFLSDAARNFSLEYDGKEMEEIGYYFENNYGLTPMDVMVVGFRIPDPDPQKDFTISYADELFRNGIVKAGFSGKTIKNIPTLKD